MALDPRTRKYLPKILTSQREIWRFWDGIKESCLEEARATRITREEEYIDAEVGRRAENLMV
jgi:hypothetical protein